MKLKTTALLITSLLVLAGCDQAEKSAQQLMGKAAEQALSEATSGLSGKKESSEKESEKTESSSQEI